VKKEGVCACGVFGFWGRCLFGGEVEDEGDVLGDLLAFCLVMKMGMLSYPRNKKDLPLFIRYVCVCVHFDFLKVISAADEFLEFALCNMFLLLRN
jgi:hypothetical protein